MSFRIQNNISALSSTRYLNHNSAAMDKSLSRLSSGFRINSGADDAAGLAASMRMRAEISSLKVASQNAQEATSLLQVAEGAMGQVDLILNRMKELATQAASGNASSDLTQINNEQTALQGEIGRIIGFTKYNGQTLLNGSFGAVALSGTPTQFVAANGVENIDVSNALASTAYAISAINTTTRSITLQAGGTSGPTQTLTYSNALGANQDQVLDFNTLGVKITVNSQFSTAALAGTYTTAATFSTTALTAATFQIGNENAATSQLGVTLSDLRLDQAAGLTGGVAIEMDTQAHAQTALATIDTAISALANRRGAVGAYVNRLGYAQSNLAVSVENKSASESTIRDVDMASEMSTFTKNQILVQSATAMLAQANSAPQSVLSLLK